MEYKREIIVFDLETTGLSFKDCGIVQFAALILNTNLEIINEYNIKINPGEFVTWNQSAVEVHGITKESVKDCRLFKDVAQEIYNLFENRDILTFNGNVFDIPFLTNHLERVDPNFILDVKSINVFDSLYIESKISSRKLGDLYKKYTGITMESAGLEAHDALSDVKATLEVFKMQDDLVDIGTLNNTVSLNKAIKYINSVKCLSMGKYRNESIAEVIEKDPDYIVWLVKDSKSPSLFREIQEVYQSLK